MALTNYDEVLSSAMETVRAATALAAQDVGFIRSLDQNLMLEIEHCGSNLLFLAKRLLMSISLEAQTISFGSAELQSPHWWKYVTEYLDSCFERVDTSLDEIRRQSSRHISQISALSIIHNENEALPEVKEKPQLNFKISVDNSDSSPFKPKLTSKPNALVNLCDSLKPIVNDLEHDLLYFAHPYKFEIMRQPYPEELLHPRDPIAPQDWSGTSFFWVDTVKSLRVMIESLKLATEIAVDLEHHDYRSYYGITCLMQISNREKDWLIDTIALRDDLQELNKIFTDPSIIKVFHGANMDILWLQRDLGLYVVSLFDTYHASKKLGFPRFSLAYLLETLVHFRTSKKFQLADWRIRPLTSTMAQYARADTHFLLYIYDVLRNKLISKGSLQDVLFESRRVACRKFEFTRFKSDEMDWLGPRAELKVAQNIISQHNIPSSKRSMLNLLLEWRDLMAREHDESQRYILPTHSLVTLCLMGPSFSIENVKSILGIEFKLSEGDLLDLFDLLKKECCISNDEPKNLPNQAFFVSYLNASALEAQYQVLEMPLRSNASLLTRPSLSICDILSSGADRQLALKFGTRSKAVSVGDQQLSSRRSTLHAEWQSRPKSGFESITLGSHDGSSQEDLPEPLDLRNEVPASPQPGNEFIVLSRKPQATRKYAKPVDTNTSVFDYASKAGSSLLNGDKRGTERKKRSFDPFSRAGTGGPKGAKRSKSAAVGKSASFKHASK